MDSFNPYEPPREVSARRVPLPGPITLAGRMSWEDGLHALELAMGRGRLSGTPTSAPGNRVAVGLALFLLIALAPIAVTPNDPGSYALLPVAMLMATLALRRRWLLRRDWTRQHGVFARLERWITEEGLQRKTEEGWTATPWSDFSRIRVSQRVLLLYFHASMSYLIFPRSLFAGEDEWNVFVRFLRDRLPER
jgi:hypothetical protein